MARVSEECAEPMSDPRIRLKDPWLSGLLAFLMPGAGHLYQGRLFKSAIYFVCIFGMFLSGMALSDWKAVQAPPPAHKRQGSNFALVKYAAQLGVGLPAMYAMVQSRRYYSEDNLPVHSIEEPISEPFTGYAELRTESGIVHGDLEGTITLMPSQGQFGGQTIRGEFTGTLAGEPVTLSLGDHTELDKPVRADQLRHVSAAIVEREDGREEMIGELRGGYPRPFKDWFQAPLDEVEERELHRKLGKFHELAMVFVWVAGLMNVLAIWDAVEGPAYGYGDEETTPHSTDPSADAENPSDQQPADKPTEARAAVN